MGLLEKIKEIEEEMARTQKNKATEHHIGLLKARLAKLRTQMIEGTSQKGGKGEGFEVQKSGDARVCIIGYGLSLFFIFLFKPQILIYLF